MQKFTVGCVIPSYQQHTLLEKHLPAVLATLKPGDCLTIIEDAGRDDTVERLVEQFDLSQDILEKPDLPQTYAADFSALDTSIWRGKHKSIDLQVVRTTTNQRFAGAVNLAVAITTADYILLLNNDVSPHSNTRTKLLEAISQCNQCFAVGCLEYSNEAQTDPSGRNKLWFERGLFQHSKHPKQVSGDTAWVSGGSGMFDRQKWIDLGGFDLNFSPAYWEDIDICQCARREGLNIRFTDTTFVLHQHESTHKDVFGELSILAMSWKHARYFTWKHATFIQRLLFLLWQPYWLYQEVSQRSQLKSTQIGKGK